MLGIGSVVVDNVARVNGLAEQIEGFVWRLQDDSGHAMNMRVYDDPRILPNLTVWENVEAVERFVYRRADAITVHSAGNRDHVLAHGGRSDATAVMPNSVDTTRIQPGPRENALRAELGLIFLMFQVGTVVVGRTEKEAHDKLEDYRRCASVEGALLHLSASMGVDLSKYELDEPIRYEKNDANNSFMDALTKRAVDTTWTRRKIIDQVVRDLEGLAAKLREIDLSTLPAAAQAGISRALEGKTLVVTGTLKGYSRDQIQELRHASLHSPGHQQFENSLTL